MEYFINFRKPTSNNLKPPDLWECYSKNKSYLQIGNMTAPSVTLQTNFLQERMTFWEQNMLH